MKYEYGVEYDFPFGEFLRGTFKADVPDDVKVEFETRYGWSEFQGGKRCQVPAGVVNWRDVRRFRIVDDRYIKTLSERERFGLALWRTVNFLDSDLTDNYIMRQARFEDYCKAYDAGFKAPEAEQ